MKGRSVVLFPDIKGFDRWEAKARELDFGISNLLEVKASAGEREKGLDLADYLTRFDLKRFIGNSNTQAVRDAVVPTLPKEFQNHTKPYKPDTKSEDDSWLEKVAGDAKRHYALYHNPKKMPPDMYFTAYADSIQRLLSGRGIPLGMFLKRVLP